MKPSINNNDFLDAFNHKGTYFLDTHKKNTLELFILKTSANEFDYDYLQKSLLENVANFSLSRKIKEKYSGKPMELSQKAREKFIDYMNNKGELGELILYSFLESHLGAPKILSKLELKTSTSHYVNGADGVHYLKLNNGNFQLIFGESKTVADITSALTDAFKSIYEFKNGINTKGKQKSGLNYEKSLISDHIEKETFSKNEEAFITSIVYPKREDTHNVDTAFGVFIGFEIEILDEDLMLPNDKFREEISNKVEQMVISKFDHILKKLKEFSLLGPKFYLYILPFSNLDKSRKEVTKKLIS